ncbi:MAG: hypothetical protein AABY32_03950 [Nanoarchaeota archaeon]
MTPITAQSIHDRYAVMVPGTILEVVKHHNTCSIFNIGICSCGLIADLNELPEEEAYKIYINFKISKLLHCRVFDFMAENKIREKIEKLLDFNNIQKELDGNKEELHEEIKKTIEKIEEKI